MSDVLEIFGVEYNNVAGIKATNNNDTELTYIRPQGTKSITSNGTGIDVAAYSAVDVAVSGGNTFIVTLQYNENTTYWEPNKTYAEIAAAYTAEKDIITEINAGVEFASAAGEMQTNNIFSYWVRQFLENPERIYEQHYYYSSNGVELADYYTYPNTDDASLDSASQMLNGVTAYSNGVKYTGNIATKTSSDLAASGATVTAPAGYYSSAATKTIASGTEGTPTAAKGTVSNHSVSVTPSVTNTAGYISGGTHNGTAVSVSASELVSGNKEITENGSNIDVTDYATVSVNVSGGGGGSNVQIGTSGVDVDSATSTISFTGLSGNPTSFIVYYNGNLTTPSGTPYKIACLVYDGTDIHGQTITNTNNAQVTYDGSSFSKSYSNGTLTLTSTGAYFQVGDYYILYSYDGTANNIKTESVQVGSGATSITFTGLEDEPIWWSCIFKSNFSTSSGYQRVIFVTDNDGLVGMAMDSQANLSMAWTATYNNGSFTITSSGTNNGGYFHQPGYYQLTYAYDASGNYQTKSVTYTPSTSQQTATITADSGYDALKKVNVTVDAMPSMTLPSSASGTSSGTSKATITPTSSAQYLNIPAGYNATAQYYTIAASGGGGSLSVATTTWTNSSNTTTSHQFTGLSGTPKIAFLKCTSQLTRSSQNTYYYIADIFWNGTNCRGNYHLRSNGSFNDVGTSGGFSVTTGTNSITFTSSGTRGGAPGSFYNGTYELTYFY